MAVTGWRQNAIVGGWESDLSLADGFWDIAERTLTEIEQRPDDGKFVPAMYNVRHAFELALKEAVRGLGLYLRREAEFAGSAVTPELTREAVEQRWPRRTGSRTCWTRHRPSVWTGLSVMASIVLDARAAWSVDCLTTSIEPSPMQDCLLV